MANLIRPLGFLLIGSVAGFGAAYWLVPENAVVPTETASTASKKPLYWVAPMDPNFKSDKPGKSPMGMDLVPVYEEGGSSNDEPGTVFVSPSVVNNLGVRTNSVIEGRLPNNVTTVGYVQYNEDEMAHVHPRVEGWIEALYVKAEGEPVEKGKALYELYSPTLVNAQEELVMALNRGNERLISAAEERLNALNVPAHFIRQLKESRQVKRTLTFSAPESGVIENLNVREGMFIKRGDRVLSIAGLNEVWVIGEVFEGQLSAVKLDNQVAMTLDYMPGRQWSGQVDYVYPEVNPKTRTARVRIRFDNDDGALLPGMFARLNIQGNRGARHLLVPREAVIRTGQSDRLVLALGKGAFKSVNVSIGRVGDQYAEVLEGAAPGDTVVTSAQFLIDSESSKTSDFQRTSVQSAGSRDPQMDHSGQNMTPGEADSEVKGETINHKGMDHGEMDQDGGHS